MVTHVVRPGESLWSIATVAVRAGLGPAATDQRIARYWASLVDANPAAVAESGDPDVIYPGTVVALPPVSAAG